MTNFSRTNSDLQNVEQAVQDLEEFLKRSSRNEVDLVQFEIVFRKKVDSIGQLSSNFFFSLSTNPSEEVFEYFTSLVYRIQEAANRIPMSDNYERQRIQILSLNNFLRYNSINYISSHSEVVFGFANLLSDIITGIADPRDFVSKYETRFEEDYIRALESTGDVFYSAAWVSTYTEVSNFMDWTSKALDYWNESQKLQEENFESLLRTPAETSTVLLQGLNNLVSNYLSIAHLFFVLHGTIKDTETTQIVLVPFLNDETSIVNYLLAIDERISEYYARILERGQEETSEVQFYKTLITAAWNYVKVWILVFEVYPKFFTSYETKDLEPIMHQLKEGIQIIEKVTGSQNTQIRDSPFAPSYTIMLKECIGIGQFFPGDHEFRNFTRERIRKYFSNKNDDRYIDLRLFHLIVEINDLVLPEEYGEVLEELYQLQDHIKNYPMHLVQINILTSFIEYYLEIATLDDVKQVLHREHQKISEMQLTKLAADIQYYIEYAESLPDTGILQSLQHRLKVHPYDNSTWIIPDFESVAKKTNKHNIIYVPFNRLSDRKLV